MAPRIDPSDAIAAHLARIDALSICCNNPDSLGARAEADNLMAGRPAYWPRGGFSSASGMLVALARSAEHNRSFLKALGALAERHPNQNITDILDRVIPLNQAAIDELGLCYRLQSSFREDLAGREREALYDPVYFPHMSSDRRERWRETYGECQRQFEERQRDLHWNRPVGDGRKLDAITVGSAVLS